MPSIPGLAILIGKKKPGADKEPEDPMEDSPEEDGSEDSEGSDETLHAIMDSFIESIKKEDVKGAVQAFKDLFQLCEEMPHEEDDHEKPEEEEES